MELRELSLNEFASELSSASPAPGGGSAAALSGALGASLVAMVCGLTLGRKKYEACQESSENARRKALELQKAFLSAVDRDTVAYNTVTGAFALPKGTDEEKHARSAAIQEGLIACIESPLTVMDLCLETLKTAEEILQGFNTSAASDLGVSALMLKTALQGAWLNVRTNLSSLKDKEKAAAYEQRARAVIDEALPLAEKICGSMEALL